MGEVIGVDSVVYNLAGDPTGRPSYLKTLVIQKALSGSNDSLADVIRRGYMNSPAVRLGSFYEWASTSGEYNRVGLPSGKLKFNGEVPANAVEPEIGAPSGYSVEVSNSFVSYAYPEYWAERFMLNNYPNLLNTAWKWDYLASTNEIRIEFAGGSTETFSTSGFDYDARYLYAYYTLVRNSDDDVSSSKLFIYKIGSGNATLDAVAQNRADYGDFFPFIPVRLDNHFLSDTYKPTVYSQVTEAYRRATGGNFDELVDKIKDNGDLDDIDHIYLSFGVSLNTKDNAAKRYIYTFLETLQLAQEGGADAYDDYKAKVELARRRQIAYVTWLNSGMIGPRPKVIQVPAVPENTIRIKGTGSVSDGGDAYGYYDVRLKWNYIRNFSRNGKGKTGATPGDVWMVADTKTIGYEEIRIPIGGTGDFTTYQKPIKTPRLRIYWQRSKSEYTYLEVVGLQYSNMIYKGHGVIHEPADALADVDESGFIIPMHYGVWASMSLVDRTQMATACSYLIFNCYKARKQKWYETGIFQIFLVIVIAIASALLTGGAGIGLLGSNLAVGTALGLSGVSAAVLGSVVNALAGLVLATVISKVTEGFGAFGALLGTIIGIVIGGAIGAANGTAAFNWGDLLRVDNLMKLLSSVGDVASRLVQEDTLAIQEKWATFQEETNQKASEIQQAFFEQFGYGAGVIDPTAFVGQHDIKVESASTFLTRTLMTGSDIAAMSQDLLYDFPKYSLDLPNAFD